MPNRNDIQDAMRYSTPATVAVEEGGVLTLESLELVSQMIAQRIGYYTAPTSGTYTITTNGTISAIVDDFDWTVRSPVKRHPKNYKNKKRASGASLP